MTRRSSKVRAVGAAALLVSLSPLMVGCTFHTTHPDQQAPEPTNGPFASVGTQTVPAVP